MAPRKVSRGKRVELEFDVIVIGAGIVGASVAYHLKQGGLDKVLLLDKGPGAASGTTGASAAIVRQHYSNENLVRLTGESMQILRDLECRPGQRKLFWQNGYHFLLPEDALEGAEENIRMQQNIGVDTRLMLPDEFSQNLEWLNSEDVAGVVFEPKGGYADPVYCTEALVDAFTELGGTVLFNSKCNSLMREKDQIVGVATDQGVIKARQTVNACGPWSMALAATADIDLPLRIFREQETIWHCPYADEMPLGSISDAVDAIYLRPLGNGRFTVGRGFPKAYEEVDPGNYDKKVDDSFIHDIQSRAQLRFLPLARARFIDGFSSLYDVSPDWYPIVGSRRDIEGYVDACGGSGHGFKLAPALGKNLANSIISGEPSELLSGLSYDRIPDDNLFIQKYGGNRG